MILNVLNIYISIYVIYCRFDYSGDFAWCCCHICSGSHTVIPPHKVTSVIFKKVKVTIAIYNFARFKVAVFLCKYSYYLSGTCCYI